MSEDRLTLERRPLGDGYDIVVEEKVVDTVYQWELEAADRASDLLYQRIQRVADRLNTVQRVADRLDTGAWRLQEHRRPEQGWYLL